jgi:hypothetical protein
MHARLRSQLWTCLTALAAIHCSGCSHPSDATLIRLFESKLSSFEVLANTVERELLSNEVSDGFILHIGNSPWNRGLPKYYLDRYTSLLRECCDECTLFADKGTVYVMLSVHGPKGSYKGLAYGPTVPGLRYRSLDEPPNVARGDCVRRFRPIRGRWYLYDQECM